MYEDVAMVKDLVGRVRDGEESWVVLVCPDGNGVMDRMRLMFSSTCPDDCDFSGRTIRLPNGGKLSLTGAKQDIFVPKEEEFSVYFCGWEYDADDPRRSDMHKWRKRSTHVLQRRTLQ